MRREIAALQSLIEKLEKRFPGLIPLALYDFEEELGFRAEEGGQFFFGWLLCEYRLFGGTSVLSLIRQNIRLSADEERFIKNVEDAIVGYFEVLSQERKRVLVRDLLTRKKHTVAVIDLDHQLEKEIIEAKLARNFDDDLFFFGGFIIRTGERKRILHELRMYTEPGGKNRRE